MQKKQSTSIKPARHQIRDTVLEQAVEVELIQLNMILKDLYATVNRFTPSLYNESIILKVQLQQVLKLFQNNIKRLQVFRQIKEMQLPLNAWENEGGSIKYD